MRVYGHGKFKRVVYSDNYMKWERMALNAIVKAKLEHQIVEPFAFNLHMRCLYEFQNRMGEPDLSALHEGIADTLQKAKIILNDRLIQSHDGSRKTFGHNVAGMHVFLFKFEA